MNKKFIFLDSLYLDIAKINISKHLYKSYFSSIKVISLLF